MTILAYCGERTCAFNNKGKCRNFKVALNEQGICMGYSPLIMPNVVSNTRTELDKTDGEINNPMGFGG